jgi:type I restriction enzyme S subunit
MNNWVYKKLSKLCSRIGDGLHGTPEYTNDSDIYFINGNNLNNGKIELNSNTKKVSVEEFENNFIPLNENSLLLSINGTIGSMAFYNDEKVMLGKSAAYLNFNSGINKFYYYYFQLTHIQRHFYNIATGSTIKNLSLKSIQDFEVPVPNDFEWKGIARVLSVIDSKIEINNKINTELESMAKTLYDYWFVQFDFPNVNGKPYKTSGGKMIWNKELKREIPQGWQVKYLRSEIEIQRGISYTSKEINGDGVPMINLNSFNLDGTYKSEGVKTYSGKFTKKNIVKPGDLLIAATDVTRNADIIGRGILVPDYYKEHLVFSMDIANIISEDIPSSFLMMLFNSTHYHNYIKWYATGTIVLHLNLDGVNRYQTELPPTSLMKQFDDFYLPIANRIYMTAKENEKLSELRDWLLPMLMNGQIKVN